MTEAVCRLWAPRAVGALAALLLLLAVLVVPAMLMWQVVAEQAAELPGQLERGWQRTRGWIVDTFGVGEAQLDAAIEDLLARLRAAAPSPAASAVGIAEALAAALLALVLMFFLLKDGPGIARWLRERLPERSRRRWSEAIGAGRRAVGRYARGMVLIAADDAVGIGVALILIGVPLALLTFLAAFVPILGATVGGAVAALVALANGRSTPPWCWPP